MDNAKQPKCMLMDEWIKTSSYIFNGMLSILKKKEILPFSTMWMNLEDPMPSDINHQKDQYC